MKPQKQVVNLQKYFKVDHCTTFLQKSRGFMCKVPDRALVFHFKTAQRVSFHMWFVFSSIDLLVLDDQQIIQEIKSPFRPFTMFNSKTLATYVVELPNGSVRRCNLRRGMNLVW